MLQSLSFPHEKETAAHRPCATEKPSSSDKRSFTDKKLASDIRRAAFNALARREHSQQELREKLLKKFHNDIGNNCADIDIPALIDHVLKKIAAEGLQSDQRYLEMLIRGRIQQGYGPIRIVQELKQKGIALAEFEDFLDLHSEEWKLRARQARKKKFGSGNTTDQKAKAKQMRFLQYRGYNTEQIRFALNLRA